jgi:hypothetical protein
MESVCIRGEIFYSAILATLPFLVNRSHRVPSLRSGLQKELALYKAPLFAI